MADTYNGYCVKCREKRDFEGEVKELANGSKAAQGQCPVCGTKMTRMLPKNAKHLRIHGGRLRAALFLSPLVVLEVPDDVHAPLHLQFAEDVGQVRLDGRNRDEQRLGYLGVGSPLCG